VTVEASVNTPRRISMMGVLAARDKKVVRFKKSDLDVDPGGIGLKGSPTQTLGYFTSESSRKVEILTGSPQQAASELLDKLGW
jgi:electron transfer flavoprotein beta subunit